MFRDLVLDANNNSNQLRAAVSRERDARHSLICKYIRFCNETDSISTKCTLNYPCELMQSVTLSHQCRSCVVELNTQQVGQLPIDRNRTLTTVCKNAAVELQCSSFLFWVKKDLNVL
jgi:hypothetical protein